MFRCKDLLTLPAMLKARIIAGSNGLSRGIRWAYKAENMGFSKWIKGNELLIVSEAVIKSEDFDLAILITEAYKFRVAGILLLVGDNFVKSISKEMLNFCNQQHLPLLALPWNIPLIDVFEELGHAISYYENKNNFSRDFVYSIIFGNEVNKDFIYMLGEELDYDISQSQQIFIFRYQLKNAEIDRGGEYITNVIQQAFDKIEVKVILSRFSSNVIGLMPGYVGEIKYIKTFEEIANIVKNNLQNIEYEIGIGLVYDSIFDIQKSYNEASQAVNLILQLEEKNKIYAYNNLGVYSLFLELNGSNALKNYCRKTLEPLINYDKSNNTELLKTLEVYLKNNCTLIPTSEEMGIHRNTIRNRIQRIEEILNCSLTQPMSCYKLHTALIGRKFIGNINIGKIK